MYKENNVAKSPIKCEGSQEVSLLSGMIGKIEMHNDQIMRLTSQLNERLDRLVGNEPPTKESDRAKCVGAAPGGLTSHLEGLLYNQEYIISNLETAIRRLSVL